MMSVEMTYLNLTVGDVRAGSKALMECSDPQGFRAACGEAWVKLVTTNPYAAEDDLALSLAVHDGVLVGRLGYYAAPFLLDGEVRKTYWMQGFYVNPSYRKTGAGGIILLHARERLPSLLAAGGPGETARKMYRALGYNNLGPLRRFLLVLNARAITYRYLKGSAIARAAAGLAAPLLGLRNQLLSRRLAEPRYTYKPVAQFSAEIDALTSAPGTSRFLGIARNLNWVLQHRPFDAFEIYDGNSLAGYCMLKVATRPLAGARTPYKARVGMLADFALRDPSLAAREDLLSFAIDYSRQRNADYVECQVRGDRMAETCLKAGFVEKEGNAVYYKAAKEEKPKVGSTHWDLTTGTSDVILIL